MLTPAGERCHCRVAAADDEGRVLILAAAVACARVADHSPGTVLEPHQVLILVEIGGKLDVRHEPPHRAFAVVLPDQGRRGLEVPGSLPELRLERAGHANRRDLSLAE